MPAKLSALNLTADCCAAQVVETMGPEVAGGIVRAAGGSLVGQLVVKMGSEFVAELVTRLGVGLNVQVTCDPAAAAWRCVAATMQPSLLWARHLHAHEPGAYQQLLRNTSSSGCANLDLLSLPCVLQLVAQIGVLALVAAMGPVYLAALSASMTAEIFEAVFGSVLPAGGGESPAVQAGSVA